MRGAVPDASQIGFRVDPAMCRRRKRLCLATVAALGMKDQLKVLLGRTWPETWINNNPFWIGNGAFGFEPLHGGAG